MVFFFLLFFFCGIKLFVKNGQMICQMKCGFQIEWLFPGNSLFPSTFSFVTKKKPTKRKRKIKIKIEERKLEKTIVFERKRKNPYKLFNLIRSKSDFSSLSFIMRNKRQITKNCIKNFFDKKKTKKIGNWICGKKRKFSKKYQQFIKKKQGM